MADNSYRIRVNVGDDENVVRVNLKQGIKTLNILSLEINPEDEYEIQTADYGVIVGRVLANGAYGIPNVKVSVFIPIDDADKSNYIISNEYPYRTPQSYDINGVKYNLIEQRKNSPGTFPSKKMVLDNNGMVEVFDKYWKYTTTTNQSGDYMIFGVPTGTCQVHYDCDLSDIGILSQHPYDFVARGYDRNLFKSMTKFNTDNLQSAVHIKSQDTSVYVYPFWGDKERTQIGITRYDIKIDYEFRPSCVFMGSAITDPEGSYISTEGVPNGSNGVFDSLSTLGGDIEVIRKTQDGQIEELKDNVKGIIDGNGIWCYMIPMNLDRIGTDEYGNKIAIHDPNKGIPTRARVRFRISLSTSENKLGGVTAKMLVPCNPELEYHGGINRAQLNDDGMRRFYNECHEPVPKGLRKVGEGEIPDDYIYPDDYSNIYEFGEKTPDAHFRDLYWGKVYSVKQYYPRFQYEPGRVKPVAPYNEGLNFYDNSNLLTRVDSPSESREMYDFTGYPPQYSFKQSTISDIHPTVSNNTFPYTTMYSSAEVGIDNTIRYWFLFHLSTDSSSSETLPQKGLHFCFENDWINGCLYFPRIEVIKRGNYIDYFGEKTDYGYDYGGDIGHDYREHASTGYTGVYISGRHNWFWDYKSKKFTTKQPRLGVTGSNNSKSEKALQNYNFNWVSVFTRSRLKNGIVTKKKTKFDQDVFYYRCGSLQLLTGLDYGPYAKQYMIEDAIRRDRRSIGYRRMYSTDIILLGNLENLYDYLPKLYESLPHTSSTFPPLTPSDDLKESGMNRMCKKKQILYNKDDDDVPDLIDMLDYSSPQNTYESFKQRTSGYTLYNTVQNEIKYLDNGTCNDIAYNDGGVYSGNNPKTACALCKVTRCSSLFFGMRVWEVDDMLVYDIPTFVNTSRLCELDVNNDSEYTTTLTTQYKDATITIPINGMIDDYDISVYENRSAFATMNFDICRYSLDSLGNRHFVPTALTINGFDGRLRDYIYNNFFEYSFTIEQGGYQPFEITNLKHAVDEKDNDYIKFRFGSNEGDEPLLQTNSLFHFYGYDRYYNYASGPLYLPENSFYFYFGLRTGFSALDALRRDFIGEESENDDYSGKVTNIKVEQIKQLIYCDSDMNVVGDCSLEIYGLSFPVYYEIYNGSYLVSQGSLNESKSIIKGLNIGIYQINVTDAMGNNDNTQFSVMNYGQVANFETWYDKDMGKSALQINNVDGYEITGVSGKTNGEWSELVSYHGVYDISGNTIRMSHAFNFMDNGYVDSNAVTLFAKFDKAFNKIGISTIGRPIMYFDVGDEEENVNVTLEGERINVCYDGSGSYCHDLSEYTQSCITSTYIVKLQNTFTNNLTLNGVPVGYISGWKADWDGLQYGGPDDEVQYINDNLNYIFDSVNVLHQGETSRGFDFSGDGEDEVSEGDKIKYMSSMFSRICGKREMELINSGDSKDTLLVTLSPNTYNGTEISEHYNNPHLYWETQLSESSSGITQETRIGGVANFDRGVPHIVGSNYPVDYKGKCFLKIPNDGDNYINNLSYYYPGPNECFGLSFFGCRYTKNSQYDEPNRYDGSGITPTISANTYCFYNHDDVSGMLAVRTVDKRFDYQFNVRTPLLLPSGYDLFTNLTNKSISQGKAWIQLFGGVRLEYDEEENEISSGITNNGPGFNAKLWDRSIVESDSSSYTFVDAVDGVGDVTETKIKIWGYSGNTDTMQPDIDKVEYNIENLGHKSGVLEASFTDCSSDFEDGYVQEGDNETIRISYKSPIEILRDDSGYDLLYSVNVTNPILEFTSKPTLNGSTLSIVMNKDSEWNGLVYTDVTGAHDINYNEKLEWAQGGKVGMPGSLDIALYYKGLTSNDDYFKMADFEFQSQTKDGITSEINNDSYVSVCYRDESGETYNSIDNSVLRNYCKFKINPNDVQDVQIDSDYLFIPTKNIFANTRNGTSLKQGVTYNLGYAYYSAPITVSYFEVSTNEDKYVISLSTPLSDNYHNVDYNVTEMNTHTIGKVVNCTCSKANSITYDENKCQIIFYVPKNTNSGEYVVYFEMDGGLKYKVVINKSETPKQYLTFEALKDTTFKFSRNNLQYSLDGGENWTELPANTNTPTIHTGSKIMWKQSESALTVTSYGIGTFSSTDDGEFKAYGNIMSLYYGDDFEGKNDLTKNNAFRGLFSRCTKLTDAFGLIFPSGVLSNHCYHSMFYNCTGLERGPRLIGGIFLSRDNDNVIKSTLNCCQNMFENCTSLTYAPILPSMTLSPYCYAGMFHNCSSLTQAPELPATTLANNCYDSMFWLCSNLVKVTDLPSKTLVNNCYKDMFTGCVSLTTAPKIMAESVGDYSCLNMFYGCTQLTQAPDLDATILSQYCYQNMFNGCSSLTNAPSLPSTILSEGCYSAMFMNCSSLMESPELPATTLVENCYDSMFWQCSRLNHVKCLATDISATNCTSNWLGGVSNRGTFVMNVSMIGWPSGASGIPYGWTVETV